jgi:hypothetical protein
MHDGGGSTPWRRSTNSQKDEPAATVSEPSTAAVVVAAPSPAALIRWEPPQAQTWDQVMGYLADWSYDEEEDGEPPEFIVARKEMEELENALAPDKRGILAELAHSLQTEIVDKRAKIAAELDKENRPLTADPDRDMSALRSGLEKVRRQAADFVACYGADWKLTHFKLTTVVTDLGLHKYGTQRRRLTFSEAHAEVVRALDFCRYALTERDPKAPAAPRMEYRDWKRMTTYVHDRLDPRLCASGARDWYAVQGGEIAAAVPYGRVRASVRTILEACEFYDEGDVMDRRPAPQVDMKMVNEVMDALASRRYVDPLPRAARGRGNESRLIDVTPQRAMIEAAPQCVTSNAAALVAPVPQKRKGLVGPFGAACWEAAGADAVISKKAAYAGYVDWCNAAGLEPLAHGKFCTAVKNELKIADGGNRVTKGSQPVPCFRGVRWKAGAGEALPH